MISRVRTTPGTVDVYGDPIPGTTRIDDLGPQAFVAPRMSADIDGAGRAGVVVGLTLFAPNGTDLDTHTDKILVEGDGANDGMYRIDGQPGDWSFRLGSNRPAGQATALVRAEG